MNFLDKLSEIFPANRLMAAATFAAGLAALILGSLDAFPQDWQNGAVAIAGLLTQLATALKFLAGSQKWDELQFGPVYPEDISTHPDFHEDEEMGVEDEPPVKAAPSTLHDSKDLQQ